MAKSWNDDLTAVFRCPTEWNREPQAARQQMHHAHLQPHIHVCTRSKHASDCCHHLHVAAWPFVAAWPRRSRVYVSDARLRRRSSAAIMTEQKQPKWARGREDKAGCDITAATGSHPSSHQHHLKVHGGAIFSSVTRRRGAQKENMAQDCTAARPENSNHAKQPELCGREVETCLQPSWLNPASEEAVKAALLLQPPGISRIKCISMLSYTTNTSSSQIAGKGSWVAACSLQTEIPLDSR